MPNSLYKLEEGTVAPRVPTFLRGQFYELHRPPCEENGWSDDDYVGWVHFGTNGTIEFGEPRA